ncbi:MAG: hypothetical protein EP332_05620 [Bacteroidetes bacterium]|nr:MAG: hypothetical protein EP332_05620 [Bacteroidota bacterium]
MFRILRIAHYSVLALFLVNIGLYLISRHQLIAELRFWMVVFWFVSGSILAFVPNSRREIYYFYLFPISLVSAGILFILNRFLFVLFMGSVGLALLPIRPKLVSGAYVLANGNSFISPTKNYDLFHREYGLEEFIMSIQLNPGAKVERMEAVVESDTTKLHLMLHQGRDTVIHLPAD